MSRILAALLVVCVGVVLSLAQEEKPRQPSALQPGPPATSRGPTFGPTGSSIPFEAVQLDGKTAWRVTGRGTVRVEELVAGMASACALRVSYTGAAANHLRDGVPYLGPDGGVVIGNAEIPDFASDLLAATGLAVVGASTGKARVVSLVEAPNYALYVSEAELAALPASEWVIVHGAPMHAGYDALESVARLRGDNNPRLRVRVIDASGFVATGAVEEVRTLLRIVGELDQPGAGKNGKLVKVYEVPQARAADAAPLINALFAESGDTVQNLQSNVIIQTRRESRVNAVAIPNTSKIVVRAAASDQSLVQAAVDAMK
jgi:hypothetical protein